MRKGGGGRGGSKMQNPRGKRGSKRSKAVHLERILVEIARVWARLSSFSSNPGAKETKRDHLQVRNSSGTSRRFRLLPRPPQTPQDAGRGLPMRGQVMQLIRFLLAALIAAALAAPGLAQPPVAFEDAGIHAVQFIDQAEGWAVGDDGVIWHSIDGGKTWERQKTGTRASLRGVHFQTPYTGWVVGRRELPGDGGSVGVMLRTTDGGITWMEMGTNVLPGLHVVRFFDDKTGFVCGDGSPGFPSGMFITADGGQTWKPVSGAKLPSCRAAAFFPGKRDGVVAGDMVATGDHQRWGLQGIGLRPTLGPISARGVHRHFAGWKESGGVRGRRWRGSAGEQRRREVVGLRESGARAGSAGSVRFPLLCGHWSARLGRGSAGRVRAAQCRQRQDLGNAADRVTGPGERHPFPHARNRLDSRGTGLHLRHDRWRQDMEAARTGGQRRGVVPAGIPSLRAARCRVGPGIRRGVSLCRREPDVGRSRDGRSETGRRRGAAAASDAAGGGRFRDARLGLPARGPCRRAAAARTHGIVGPRSSAARPPSNC